MAHHINIEYWKYGDYVSPYCTFTNNTKQISPEQVQALNEVAEQVTFKDSKSVRRRMGVNGPNALSIYETAKWYFFGAANRAKYKAQFPADKIAKAFTGWFLRVPPDGFIDKIANWTNKATQNMYYCSIALRDNQLIMIDDRPHVYNAGDVCWFNIRSTYEIPKTATEQLWACILVAEY